MYAPEGEGVAAPAPLEQFKSDRTILLEDPRCHLMEELPVASSERAKVAELIRSGPVNPAEASSPLFIHLSHGLAYTIGSALGSIPPSLDTCLSAFLVPNSAGLTAGARAWSKHSHRSQSVYADAGEQENQKKRSKASAGWWGSPSGPVAGINEKALELFWKVMNSATWRNLHWLPHQVLVYEVRVVEGYGMRWFQDQGNRDQGDSFASRGPRSWVFRGFVEPIMENGHETGWRHSVDNIS